jgi:MATE family multidrug resistance protein
MREMLRLSLPLIISTLSWTVMHFTDRVFLNWYSVDAMAAAMPAGALSFAVICFPLGVAAYVNAFVSQYYGAGRHHRIGLVVWQGVWLGLLALPFALATVPLAAAMFPRIGHSTATAAYELDFYGAISWGAGAMVAAEAMSAFFTGRGRVRTVMVVDMLAALVNVVLDYALIFGHRGFPEWGAAGAGAATAVAMWFKAIVYLTLFLRKSHREEFGTLTGCRFDPALFRRLLRFGAPSGAQLLCDVGAFTVILLIVGKLGKLDLAATSLAFNLNALAFMPVYGIGIATTTAVGHRQGQNRPELAERAAWSAFALAAIYMIAISALYVLAPQALLWMHAAKADPTEFNEVKRLTIVLLRYVALYNVFDAMVVIFSGAIKGAGDTRFVLWTTLCMSPLPVIATIAGVEWFGLGLYWSWITITAWLCVLGVIYMLRFRQGKWRTMRVIEAVAIDETEIGAAREPDAFETEAVLSNEAS